ncbi:MAG: hypothetical protein PHQ04_04325 [Opitutaceae bacterium]|nr:hypothetical protein [Opitutaceae bacterium]
MQTVDYIPEPDLEFGRDKHPDIRYGILNFGPYDLRAEQRPTSISVALVGTSRSISVAERWIVSAKAEVAAKVSPKINLFAPFPGFSSASSWACDVVVSARLNTLIDVGEIKALSKPGLSHNEKVRAAVELFLEGLKNSAQKRPHVLILALPVELLALIGDDAGEDVSSEVVGKAPLSFQARKKAVRGRYNFHDMLKAKALPLGIPLQLLRPSTCDPKLRREEKDGFGEGRQRQDDATCAWNFFVALYYKAGGYPWRLRKQHTDLTTCFIGISFYESLDQTNLQSSLAQVFDERGHGMIVKGGRVVRDEVDHSPHLDNEGARALVTLAIDRYRREHRTNPARVVVHKSSKFTDAERDGAKAALEAFRISEVDLLSLDRSFMRLARNGYYPPLRGTCWAIDDDRTILYTNGSVQLYEEYPGLYVPRTLMIRHDQCVTDRQKLATEILALTKMNWNNSQITAREPITLRAAREVAKILKYVDDPNQEALYSFFM